MHRLSLIEYGSPAYRAMVSLRDDVLRRPLGLVFSAEYLAREAEDILIGCYEAHADMLLGCCMLTPAEGGRVQLRQMAVREGYRGTGIGREIVAFAENLARERGFRTVVMHARKTAVPFYARLGYGVSGVEFLEVGISHLEMRKPVGDRP